MLHKQCGTVCCRQSRILRFTQNIQVQVDAINHSAIDSVTPICITMTIYDALKIVYYYYCRKKCHHWIYCAPLRTGCMSSKEHNKSRWTTRLIVYRSRYIWFWENIKISTMSQKFEPSTYEHLCVCVTSWCGLPSWIWKDMSVRFVLLFKLITN